MGSLLIFSFISGESEKVSEMFDNPLYGSMKKSHSRSLDQDNPQRDLLTPPDPRSTADGDSERPPVPTPRNRSFTCSETKPPLVTPIGSQYSINKKPVVPSRSEGGMPYNRPPLPYKNRPEPQTSKPRDYRDNSELPIKQRPPARPGQSQPQRDGKNTALARLIRIQPLHKSQDGNSLSYLAHPEVTKMGRPVK